MLSHGSLSSSRGGYMAFFQNSIDPTVSSNEIQRCEKYFKRLDDMTDGIYEVSNVSEQPWIQ